MPENLPLRAAGRVSRLFAAALVPAGGVDLETLAADGVPTIYIAPWGSRLEERVVRASLEAGGLAPPRWIASRRRRTSEDALRAAFLAGEPVLVPLAAPRHGPDRLARLLSFAREADRPVRLVPLEPHWGPQGREVSFRHLILGNPFDPPRVTRWLRLRSPRHLRVLVGPPGTLAELAAQAPDPDDALALSSFVRGQAVKALSLAERQFFGDGYKVARFLVEDVLREPAFRDRAAAAGATRGLTRQESLVRAERGLRELATRHDPFTMGLLARAIRWAYTRVYDAEIGVDPAALDKLRELGKTSSLVFVPSHKSNFDHLLLYYLLYTAGFPPPHTAAGNNMAFFPMGRILPRTGAFFIRRSFQDDPVYKEAFGGFIHYLVQRRFHQEFFIEGGRTRSGKLLPPRYGMLSYIVDAARRSDVDDAQVVPTAITYDQVLEVDEYVRELRGAQKERESFGFLVRMIRSLRRRDLGRVYVSFGEPIALADHLARSGDDRLIVEKLSFHVANRINAVTRLTAVALVCSALLGAGRRALSRGELDAEIEQTLEFARERDIPLAEEPRTSAAAALEAGLAALRGADTLGCYEDGVEPVWFIPEEGRQAATFYRNSSMHFFLIRALTRLAEQAADGERDAAAWAFRIRDLLKFEFFFPERDAFGREVERERASLAREAQRGLPPLRAAGPAMLADYFESYLVVVETLRRGTDGRELSESALLERCQAIGRQLLLQQRVHAPELLSNANFRNGLRLARNLGAARGSAEACAPGDVRALETLGADLDKLARLAHPDAG